MLKNNTFTIGVLIIALFLLLSVPTLFSWGTKTITEYQAFKSIDHCKDVIESEGQIECIFDAIDTAVEGGSLKKAFAVFSSAYKNFESFSGSGCHRHAHRVGDTVYYKHYIFGEQDIGSIDFPQETTACGYGLFHGFLEHLIQDHPDTEFSMDVCETLERNLSSTMKDIRVICYHGAGHGYTLAHAETLKRDVWGDVRAFSDVPVSKCNALDRARESEREDCRQGVFNVIADWMEVEDYGFSQDTDDPFKLCRLTPELSQYACYYEMAQKITKEANNDPVKLYEIASSAPRPDLVDIAFRVSVAGIIQDTIISGSGYEHTLERCTRVPSNFFRPCIESIVWGLYEHGPPQEEYKNVLLLCEDPLVEEGGEKDTCYEKTIDRLPRFYDDNRIESVCSEFPETRQEECMNITQKRS